MSCSTSTLSRMLGALARQLWEWSGLIEFSHVIACLIFLWYSKRQPRSKKRSGFFSLRGGGSTTNKSSRTTTTTTTTSSNNLRQGDSGLGKILHDPIWQSKATPASTMEERKRFYIGCRKNLNVASNRCRDYLVWRETHRKIERDILPTLNLTGDQDTDDWLIATAVASAARQEKNPQQLPLPQMGRMHRIGDAVLRDKGGHRIVCVNPGRMDDRIVNLKTYALAFALYLDRKVAPGSTETVTLMIDVRAGVGWRNRNGAQLLPFIQHTCGLLLTMFPERLARSMVYPVPSSFQWVWRLAQKCLDRATAEKITVFTGPATKLSPPPSEQMAAFLDPNAIVHLENERKATFIYDKD